MSQTNNKDYVMRGAGGGGDNGGGSSYSNRPDNLRSTDSFEILLGLGSGRWKGLVNGLKSLYVNDVPLENADGTSNFRDFAAIFADGDPTQQQTVTFKLGGGGGITNVGVNFANNNTAASGTPGDWITAATTTPDADFVDFRFVVSQLYHSKPNGMFDATARLEIQMRPQGSATWVNPLAIPYVSSTTDPAVGTTPITTVPSPITGGGIDPVTHAPAESFGNPGATYTLLQPTRLFYDSTAASQRPDNADDEDDNIYMGGAKGGSSSPSGHVSLIDFLIAQDYATGTGTMGPVTSGSAAYLVIKGKTMSPYVKELRIAVPKAGVYANKTWEVRVRLLEPHNQYINPNSEDQEQIARSIAFESITSVRKGVLGLAEEWRGLAWLQLVGKASDQLSGFPSLRGIYDTKVVKVPNATVFNPETRTYTGNVWDGTFANAYTNDPAWCIKDLIEDEISGIAAMSPGATLDKWDALEASKYCSGQVSDGRGGTQPRFSMNFRLEQAMNAEELIQYVAGAFNGLCVDTGGGKWRLKIDKPETPVATFTIDNIFGDFQYSHTDMDSRFNDITLTFLNEENNYQEDRVRIFDQAHINKYGRKPTTIVAVGATNRQEVVRRGVLRLRTSLNENKVVKFVTNRQGKFLEPLQTILIADQHLGYLPPTGSTALADADPFNNRTTSRIVSMNAGRTEITLGRSVRLEPSVTYKIKTTIPNPNYNPVPSSQPTSDDWKLPTITIERTLTNTSGQRGDVTVLYLNSALPASIPENAVIALDAVGLPSLPVQYRIIDVAPTGGEEVQIAAILVDTGKYTAADNASGDNIPAWLQTGNTTSLARPGVPTWGMFTLTEYPNNGTTQRMLTVNWTRPASLYLKGFQVEQRVQGSAWTVVAPLTQQTHMDFIDPVPGRHDYRITAYDLSGNVSPVLIGGIDIPAADSVLGPIHTYGDYADRPSSNLVVGQVYTALNIPLTPTYYWDGTVWINIATNGADVNGAPGAPGAIVNTGSVTPNTPLTAAELVTLQGIAAGFLNQGSLATLNSIGARNLVVDGSFERGIPNKHEYPDGGGTNLSRIFGGGFQGDYFLRMDAIGGHRIAFTDSKFIATHTSVAVSIMLKDSGLVGSWNASSIDKPHPVIIRLHENLLGATGGAGTLEGPWFVPNAGDGWKRYTCVINNVVVGQEYYIGISADGASGKRMVDVDAIMVSNGQVPLDFLSDLASAGAINYATQLYMKPSEDLIIDDFSYMTAANFEAMYANPAATYIGSTTNGEIILGQLDATIPGGKYVQIGNNNGNDGRAVLRKGEPIPIDPTALYELSVTVRRRGTGYNYLYIGFQGLAADKTTFVAPDGTSAWGSNHIAAFAEIPPLNTWVTYTGYVKGKNTSGSVVVSPDPSNPAAMHSNAVYMQPYVNFLFGDGQSIYDLGYLRVRKVDMVRLGSMLLNAAGTTTLTDNSVITVLGTASAITSQGSLATANAVVWTTQVTGAGKPANNAGTSGLLTPIGTNSTVTGNFVQKSSGTHGAFQGGAVGAPQRGSCFITSSVLNAGTGGGWDTSLALDDDATSFSLAGNKYVFTLKATSATAGHAYLYSNGTLLDDEPVANLTVNSRMSLVYDGTKVFCIVNGIAVNGMQVAATGGQVLYPKVLDYYVSSGADGAIQGIADVLYGPYWLQPDINSNFIDTGSGTFNLVSRSAILTSLGTAAGITGQGTLATLNQVTWLTHITGTGKPEDYATRTGLGGNELRDDFFGPLWTKATGSNAIVPTAGNGYVAGNAPAALEFTTSSSQNRNTDSELVPIIPNQRYFFSMRAQRGTNSNATVDAYVLWYDVNKTYLSTSLVGPSINSTTVPAGQAPKEFRWYSDAPSTAYYAQLRFRNQALGTTGHTVRIEAPKIALTPPGGGGSIDFGPPTATFLYKTDGVTPESGEVPRTLVYKVNVGGVYQVSGVTWTYKIISGGINGFTSASGSKPMTGAGSGSLDINSVESSNSVIEISAASSFGTAITTIQIIKTVAAASYSSGGGGSGPTTLATKSSGFTSINSTTFTDITGAFSATMPSGQTQATLNATLNFNPILGTSGNWVVEMKWQRLISGVWTDVGSMTTGATSITQEQTSDPGEIPPQYAYQSNPATVSNNQTNTGLVSGSAQQWRVVARLTSGTKNHSITGTVSITSP